MKKIFALTAILALTLSLTISAAAAQLDYITDDAGVLSKNEWSELETCAREIAGQYPCGVYAVIVEDYTAYGFTVEDACHKIYQDFSLGYGEDGDAIMLLLSLADRDYYLGNYGAYGEYAVTDYGLDTVEVTMLEPFGEDDWYGGLHAYLAQCAELLEAAKQGDVITESERSVGARAVYAYGIALVVGVIAAFVTCTAFKAQMKTAVRATMAEQYVSPAGVDMRIREDRYTHTTRIQRKIERASGGSHRGGGRSGGGRSGRSGKF